MLSTVRALVLGVLALLAGVVLAATPRRGRDDAPEPAAPAPEPERPAPALFTGQLPVGPQQTPAGLASLSAQSCNACHFQAHDAWNGSAHASAWRSPSYRAALARAGESTACTQCHLPLANQHAKLAVGYIDQDLSRPAFEANAAWDPSLMAEGVGCAACHVRDGVIIGPRGDGGGAHPAVASAELTSPQLCAACHQLSWPEGDRPFYDTYGEWERSAYAKAGVRCQDCHMPPTPGPATATRFAAAPSHSFSADLRRALTVLMALPGPDIQRGRPFALTVRVLNTGAGHHVPTGSPFRRYRIAVELVGAGGKLLAPPQTRDLARDIEDAPPWKTLADSRLAAGEEISLAAEFTVDQKLDAQEAIIRVTIQPISPGAGGPAEAAVSLQEIPVRVL